jgi:GNAT superfamily N-acetyltransferase
MTGAAWGPGGGALVVRDARAGDIPRIWEMLRGMADFEKLTEILSGTPELLAAALFGDGPRLGGKVAEHGGKLIGYALYYPVFGSFRARWRLWLEDLWVEPDARGLGVGERLLAAVCREAETHGYYGVDWEVLDWNRPAIEFYEHLGANRIGTDWFRYRLEGEALRALIAKAEAAPR